MQSEEERAKTLEATLPMGTKEYAQFYKLVLDGGSKMHSEYFSAVVAVASQLGLPKELLHLAIDLIYPRAKEFHDRYGNMEFNLD